MPSHTPWLDGHESSQQPSHTPQDTHKHVSTPADAQRAIQRSNSKYQPVMHPFICTSVHPGSNTCVGPTEQPTVLGSKSGTASSEYDELRPVAARDGNEADVGEIGDAMIFVG